MSPSRRLLCRVAAGGIAGALLVRLGWGEAAAGCTKIRKHCSSSKECCGNPHGPGKMRCAINGRDKGKRCCVPDGGKCITGTNSDAQCCGRASLCDGGFCNSNM